MRKTIINVIVVIIIITLILRGVLIYNNDIKRFTYKKIQEILIKSFGIQVQSEKYEGNIIKNIKLYDVSLLLKSGDEVFVEKLECNHNLFLSFLKRKIFIEQLLLINPRISLAGISSSGVTNKNGKKLPNLEIKKLIISNGRIIKSKSILIDSIFLQCNVESDLKDASLFLKKGDIKIFQRFRWYYLNAITGKVEINNEVIKLQNFSFTISHDNNFKLDAVFYHQSQTIEVNFYQGTIDVSNLSGNYSGKFNISGYIKLNWNESGSSFSIRSATIDFNTNNFKIGTDYSLNFKGILNCTGNAIAVNIQGFNNEGREILDTKINLQIDWGALKYKGELLLDRFILYPEAPNEFWGGVIKVDGDHLDFLNCTVNLHNTNGESITANIKISKKFTVKSYEITTDNLAYRVPVGELKMSAMLILDNKIKSVNTRVVLVNFDLTYPSLPRRLFLAFYNPSPQQTVSGYLTGIFELQYRDKTLISRGNLAGHDVKISGLQINRGILQYTINTGTNRVMLDLMIDQINSSYIPEIQNVELSIKNNFVTFRIGNVINNQVCCKGVLNLINSKIFLGIDSLFISGYKYSIQNTESFYLGITDSIIFLKNVSLAFNKGMLRLGLIKLPNQSLAIDFSGCQIALENICELLQSPFNIKGNLDFTFQSGVFLKSHDSLVSRCNLRVQDIQFPFRLLNNLPTTSGDSLVNIKNFICNIGLFENKLIIDALRLVYREDTSQLVGHIIVPTPNTYRSLLNYSWIKNIPEMPLALDVQFSDPGSWIFFFLKNIVDLKDAYISGGGRITGTLNSPQFYGSVFVNEGIGEIVPTHTSCSNITAQLEFYDKFINIKNISADAGVTKEIKNNVKASGSVKLINFTSVDTFFLLINFRNTPVRLHKEMFAVVSGSINVSSKSKFPKTLSGAYSAIAPLTLMITGDVTITEALITTEFGKAGELTSFSKPDIIVNLKIIGERDIWLRNSLTDCELGVNLSVLTQESDIIWTGELQALQGNIYYLDHVLKLTRGVIIFDNISEINPLVDISAELLTRPLRVEGNLPQQVKIIFNLSGRLKEPYFTFSSDPPYLNENDIVSYLNFNMSWQELSAIEARELVTKFLSNKLIGYFERELSKKIREKIFFDYFWIESGLLSENGVKVTLGKYFGPKLYVNYEYNVTSNIFDVFRIEYYLSKYHTIVGEHTETGNYRILYQYNIRY
ncbi:MAG: translocation/assembly module TamB domain-containing protein [candidate division WOR-3 bacterium]